MSRRYNTGPEWYLCIVCEKEPAGNDGCCSELCRITLEWERIYREAVHDSDEVPF